MDANRPARPEMNGRVGAFDEGIGARLPDVSLLFQKKLFSRALHSLLNFRYPALNRLNLNIADHSRIVVLRRIPSREKILESSLSQVLAFAALQK